MSRTSTTVTTLLTTLAMAGCFTEADPVMGATDTDASGSSTTAVVDETGSDDDIDPPGTTGQTDPTGSTTDPTDTDGEPVYEFDESPPGDFVQVDRMGMPAINTAVITEKDLYNQSSPADDAMGIFVDQIVANVTGLHNALDDDLIGQGLVPCIVETCVAQAAPLVVPDTLKITLSEDAGFPNGRLPADTVIDVTLAVVLLDLSVPGQDPFSLVGLNPTANDVEFSEDFPFFAAPH